MDCRLKLKNFIKMNDFFHSIQFLRYEKENDYRTFTGGLISLVIITVILIGFAQMIISTFNLSTITYTMKIQKQAIPSEISMVTDPQRNFMFGISFRSLPKAFNLSDSIKFIDFQMFQVRASNGNLVKKELLQLEMCTIPHWKNIVGTVQNFEELEVSNWLCPKIGQNLTILGKKSNRESGWLEIRAMPCKNDTNSGRSCATTEQIQKFFTQNDQGLFVTIFYQNTIINPHQQQYLSYYLQDLASFRFNNKMGVQSSLFFSDFEIQTDYSILPFQNIKKQEGFFVNQRFIQHPIMRNTNQTPYFLLYMVKADDSFQYKRQVQKISSVLSFVGGLIGAIVAILFIINSFTNYSYEISLALKVFNSKVNNSSTNDQNGQEKEKDLPKSHIFQFIKYNFYTALKAVRRDTKWTKMQNLELYRDQIIQQLNVKSILKRLIFVEFCLKHLFQDYQLEQLKSILPYKPSQIKRIRQTVQPYQENQAFDKQKQVKISISQNRSLSLGNFNLCKEQEGDFITTNKQKICFEEVNSLPSAHNYELDPKLRNGVQNFLKLQNDSLKGGKISSRILCTSIKNLQSYTKKHLQTQSQLNNRQQFMTGCNEIPVILQNSNQYGKKHPDFR